MNRLDARTIANRQNARKSTGPTSAEGKARSRLNAFQHGLAGQGVAWPGEEQAEVDGFVAEQVELERTQDARETFLATRAAVLSWQIARAERIEAARARVRSARGRLDELERRDRDVEALVTPIETEPHRAVRSLLRTAEGCEWILSALHEFVNAVQDDWMMPSQNARLDALCLPPLPGLFRVSRAKLLAEALCHNNAGVWPNGVPGIDPLPPDHTPEQWDLHRKQIQERIRAERPLWLQELREILRKRIQEVQSILDEYRRQPDPGLELAELTAAFDDSTAGERLRRYQRHNIRERKASLQELDAWRASAADRQTRPTVEIASLLAEDRATDVGPTNESPTEAPNSDAPPAPLESKSVANEEVQDHQEKTVTQDWLRSDLASIEPTFNPTLQRSSPLETRNTRVARDETNVACPAHL